MENKGQTLIEMLATVAIFSIIIGAISGLFISGIRIQRRILATQELLDQTSYILEYMGRALRMARKQLNCSKTDPTTCSCLTAIGYGYGYNYEIDPITNGIKFIDYNGICTGFYLDTGSGEIKKAVGSNIFPLTSTFLRVNSLKFNLSGEAQPPTDSLQPRVTIFLEIESKKVAELSPKIKIQTSISQRNLDFQY